MNPVRTKRSALVAGTLLVSAPATLALAHHSFGAEFDRSSPVRLEGTVVRFEWVNPHSWLVIDVAREDGSIVRWRVEGSAPSALLRRGWSRNSLPAGTHVIVDGFRAKDGSPRADARGVVVADGRRLLLGSARTGASYGEESENDADSSADER